MKLTRINLFSPFSRVSYLKMSRKFGLDQTTNQSSPRVQENTKAKPGLGESGRERARIPKPCDEKELQISSILLTWVNLLSFIRVGLWSSTATRTQRMMAFCDHQWGIDKWSVHLCFCKPHTTVVSVGLLNKWRWCGGGSVGLRKNKWLEIHKLLKAFVVAASSHARTHDLWYLST